MSYAIESNNQGSKTIHINSENAHNSLDSSITTNFQLFLDESVKCPQNERMLISLHSATVPYSFYNIRSDVNNTVGYKLNGVYGEFNITPGNYTSTTLINFLEPTISSLLTGDLVIIFDRTIMKFNFTLNNVSDDNTFKFDFTTSPTPANIELGFKVEETNTISHSSGLVSANVVDVNGSIHGLFVRTNLSSEGCFDSFTKGFNTILGRIPITTNFGSVLFFEPMNSVHKILIHKREIHTLTIRLTDEKNRLVDLNGLHFSIALQVDFTHHKSEIAPSIDSRYMPKRIEEPKSNKKELYHTKTQKDKRRYLL
mgnify:CR=1 FL=1|tara:strand:- start:524 stop:1459 length:936 start_codon:yes stop_codon:yes gene_type:complete